MKTTAYDISFWAFFNNSDVVFFNMTFLKITSETSWERRFPGDKFHVF